jgi:hypothetical protein
MRGYFIQRRRNRYSPTWHFLVHAANGSRHLPNSVCLSLIYRSQHVTLLARPDRPSLCSFLEVIIPSFRKCSYTILFSTLFGYRCNQLPLIERFPQWLSGPSPPLSVTAGPPVSNRTRFKWCSDAQHFLFNYRHRWHKMHKAVEAWKQKRSV